MVPSLALNAILISSSLLLTTFLLQSKKGHLRSKREKSWILTATATSVVSLGGIPFLYQALRSKWEWIEKFMPKENVLSIMILWIFLTEVITLVSLTPRCDYSTASLFSVIYALQCWWSRQFIKQQLNLRNQFKKSKILQSILYSHDELEKVLDDLQQNPIRKNFEPRDGENSSYMIRKKSNRQRMFQLQPNIPTIFEEDESEMQFDYVSNEITNSEYGYLTTIIEEDEDESGDSGYNSSNEKFSDPYDEQFFNVNGLDYSSIKQSPQILTTL
ncbi:23547_t:CDS:2 [Dentiscutata erythropus]|uniref:23547_t:CDS:1 n=1 Tax=Dentiscutata erythropus TaxID=1348616 RepID=A0A9N9J342_9GLOM|nr:23547_t:CDS:2 [Dentiscutata erythropus]